MTQELLRRVVNQNETFVHHFDSEPKKQSTQWKHPVIIMVDYLEEDCMINGACYAEELMWLRQEIVNKIRGTLTRCVLLL